MNKRRNDGNEPAFPGDFIGKVATGMSLRDWFAGQALVGLLAVSGWEDLDDGTEDKSAGDYADTAFQLADAMLAERSK